jgi:transposase
MMISCKIYVGMDVHKDSVVVAVLPEDAEQPTMEKKLPNDLGKLRKFFARLAEDGEVRACYEASGAGYVLHRALKEWGHHCDVVASSLIPMRPGDHRKFDRKDATQLARWYRAGELVTIRIPTEAEERVRDLVRCRETFQRELLKSRHYLLKFLARRGLVFRDGHHWTQRHFRWLRELERSGALEAEDRLVFNEYLALLDYKLQRRQELDRQIEEIALRPGYKEAVGRLACYRGIDTHGAMVLATEIGDFRRFEDPRQLMAYVGLVPKERSSGADTRLGSITKAGNSRCRHILVQAAWSYRHPPRVGLAQRQRHEGQAAATIAHSWKAQHRLNKLFRRLEFRRNSRIAAVAVARELVGFLWASMQDFEWTNETVARTAA